MIEVRHYFDLSGRDVFTRWFDDLDREAAARVEKAVFRLTYGNMSNVKAVGGVSMNLRSTSALGTGFTSGGKEARSSSSSAAARRNGSNKISVKRKRAGRNSNLEVDRAGRPLTGLFKDIVIARMKREPAFAAVVLREGVDALFSGELLVGKGMLRDYVNGTIGFEKLAKKVKIPVKSLMRMLGPSGNPQMSNLFSVIGALQVHAGIKLHVAE